MSAQDGKSQPETVRISEGAAGGVVDVRPTSFLERWGTVFVAWGLLLGYYLLHLPAFPSTTGTPADVKVSLDIHKEIYEQYHDSITNVFDLLVTKTVLPLVTLLLGYLFGKTPSRPS